MYSKALSQQRSNLQLLLALGSNSLVAKIPYILATTTTKKRKQSKIETVEKKKGERALQNREETLRRDACPSLKETLGATARGYMTGGTVDYRDSFFSLYQKQCPKVAAPLIVVPTMRHLGTMKLPPMIGARCSFPHELNSNLLRSEFSPRGPQTLHQPYKSIIPSISRALTTQHEFKNPLDCRYVIVCPQKCGIWDLLKYVFWGSRGGRMRFLESSDEDTLGGVAVKPDRRWVIVVSIIALKIIHLFSKPLEHTGYVVDFFLNLISQNGGFIGLLRNLLTGNVVVPQRGTETYTSIIAQIDGRVDLYHGPKIVENFHCSASGERSSIKAEMGNRELMDLCMMASKLSYENAEVVRNVVVHHWKMHFVAFYDCWNDFQKEESTQVFILCDKPKDASLILISFRGTEPFNADDWSTDFDYSWYEIPGVGKIHMGFLEALGLGSRNDNSTFHDHLQVKSKVIAPEMVKRAAYCRVRRKLESLLGEHKNAKFIVTGHSLGGALAILFPTVLVLHEEMGLMQRLLGVYTFGQPRIGDRQLGKYMEAHLDYPVRRYFRVVYCNDLVPRLPYDDKTFLYKHFGVCLYYDSCYNEHIMNEEPNKNFSITDAIPVHLNAVWELIRGLTMGYTHGPEYKEGWLAICVRILGLVLPGTAAHCPIDYINSIRLGKSSAIPKSSF